MNGTADKNTEINRTAWNAGRFEAWNSAYGSAEDEARRIVADPGHVIRRLMPYLGEISGKRICNVQGSHGRIAVALALLGADVQVIDFSEENRRYACDLAAAANVSIKYTVCDIMKAGKLGLNHKFDVLVLELGILHYHLDLESFFSIMYQLAAKGGLLVLNEFHPVQRKLSWEDGPTDYFHNDLVEADVPHPDADGRPLGKCLYRFWTMGEIVNSAVKAGLTIERLDEHPDWENATIPGSFTLVARSGSTHYTQGSIFADGD